MSRSRTPPAGQPIVATVGRAGELLDVDPDRLAQAIMAARLVPWGEHATGAPVFRWGALCTLAAELGSTIPARYQHAWRHYRDAADRGRASRYNPSKQPRSGRAGEV